MSFAGSDQFHGVGEGCLSIIRYIGPAAYKTSRPLCSQRVDLVPSIIRWTIGMKLPASPCHRYVQLQLYFSEEPRVIDSFSLRKVPSFTSLT